MAKRSINASRRAHERVAVTMPVRLAGKVGKTRNVSVGGIYFEMDGGSTVGSEISFEIEMDTPQGPMKLKCSGQVVRTERKDGRTGIAVRMAESWLETVQ